MRRLLATMAGVLGSMGLASILPASSPIHLLPQGRAPRYTRGGEIIHSGGTPYRSPKPRDVAGRRAWFANLRHQRRLRWAAIMRPANDNEVA